MEGEGERIRRGRGKREGRRMVVRDRGRGTVGKIWCWEAGRGTNKEGKEGRGRKRITLGKRENESKTGEERDYGGEGEKEQEGKHISEG